LENQILSLEETLAALRTSTNEQLARNEEQLSTLNSQLVVAKSEAEQLANKSKPPSPIVPAPAVDMRQDDDEVNRLKQQLAELQVKVADSEKEQEDLLVLLEEVTSKRRVDKVKMRQAGMDVSDDEDEGDDDSAADDSELK
jgi:hypothetical protein